MDRIEVIELGAQTGLPEVQAPSLEELSVTLPAPAGFNSEQVQLRFLELARPYATERYRGPSEQLRWGDEVMLAIAGYSQGRLIPFSIRTGVWLTLEPEPMLPGLYEALVGRKPTEGLVVDITLPREYPIPSLRGSPARFLVHIQAAREVQYPALDSAEFLRAFGRGATVEEATRSIVNQMVNEAAQALLLQGQQRILEEVATRTPVLIPSELIDEEIRRRWSESEGRSVRELEFTEQEQRESLETWLKDESTRREAERRLRLALALGAICRQERLTLTQQRVQALIQEHADAAGVTLEAALESLRAEPQNLARIDQVAWHQLAVDFVMSRAQLRFAPA